jgi:hypothetical protein
MNLAVVIFVIGSAIQCSAVSVPMLFVGMFRNACAEKNIRIRGLTCLQGRAIAGFAVGQLTQIVPLFISEVRVLDV